MRIYKITSIVIALVGLLVMFGWFVGNDTLTRIVPGFVTMKITTAFCFFLSGILLFLRTNKRNSVKQYGIFVSCYTIFIIMSFLLIEALFNIDLGFHNLLVIEQAAVLSLGPGIPSIATMFLFFLVATMGLLFIENGIGRMIRLFLGGIIGFVSGVGLLGYFFNIQTMYYYVEGKSTAMAIHTCLLFFIIGLSTILYEHYQKAVTKLHK